MSKELRGAVLLVGPLVALAIGLIFFVEPMEKEDFPSIMPPGSKLPVYEAAVGANGEAPHIRLKGPVRVVFIGGSAMAGRGHGKGSVAMDGARALSAPTQLRHALIAEGYAASSESFNEANNTGGSLENYDRRVKLGGWVPAKDREPALGGRLLKAGGPGASLSFRPSSEVDTFVVWTPQQDPAAIRYSLDGGAETALPLTASAGFQHTIIKAPAAGRHTLTLKQAGTAPAYVAFVEAYDSYAKDFRIINMSTRNASTKDWLVHDRPWSAAPGLKAIAPDVTIISLGPNDFREGGAHTSLDQFKANMQSLINQAKKAGSVVILVMPMPVDKHLEDTFTQDEMVSAYNDLADLNLVEWVRTDLLLGGWKKGHSLGQTADGLHWKAPAGAALGKAMVPHVVRAAGIKQHIPLELPGQVAAK